MAGRRQDAVHTHIHPGHLVQSLTGGDEPIRIHPDAVVGPLPVSRDDAFHHRVGFVQECAVAAALNVQPHSFNEKERRVHSVVHRLLCALREKVRHKAVFLVSQEGAQDALCILIAAGLQAAAGQSDHRVAAPVAEQRVTRQNGLAVGGGPPCDKGIGRRSQLRSGRVCEARLLLQRGQAHFLLAQELCARSRRFAGEEHHLELSGLARLHGAGDGKTGCRIAKCRAAVLFVCRVVQLFPLHRARGQRGVREDVHRFATGSDLAVFKAEGLVRLFQRVLFGGELQLRHDLECTGPTRTVLHGVESGGGVFLPAQGELPLHHHAADVIPPAGRILIGKAAEVFPAVLCRFFGKTLGREEGLLLPDAQHFFQPVHQHHAAVGGLHGCRQKSLIAPRCRERCRRGQIAAQTVRQQDTDVFCTLPCAQLLFSVNKPHSRSLVW